MLNNAFIIRQLARQLDAEPDPSSTMSAPMRERLHSEPVMVPGLPTTAETVTQSLTTQLSRGRRNATPESLTGTIRPEGGGRVRAAEKENQEYQLGVLINIPAVAQAFPETPLWSAPSRHGGDTPLLHAMRCGPGHQDVAIVILGAFSRFINHLSDEDFVRPGTKILLRALRVNLRAAIDMGLHTRQVDLVASFLQTLVMSEGERWVSMQAASVAAAMRRETEDKPVKTAENAVRGFATKELGKANTIMTCEDYIANATGDLLMMGAWHAAVEAGVEGELIPTWYFARDDRVYRAFAERLKEHKKELEQRCSKRLKWQLRLLDFAMAQRASTWHQKVGMVEQELDHGEGVN
ncbi:hypothetical protein EVJ58_g7417 [Rhodofomes roseus]|uniref:Uncharacterized protein n=1 Tax=Rhodofomes roseus TaxID=34475 RepID=A0A4Y9Y2W7_9APHY|nr:hypothetical protein EVJ58_g7417 [Rhodofomes roseus]